MTAPATLPTLQHLALGMLHESPLNTRKLFDPAKLEELAVSIRTSGILEPLLVRPKGKGYEIAGGHRRHRAAKAAGIEFVPAIVREMDDATFLEVLTIDNLQRENLHPLEEAEGYKNLLTLDGYDVPKVAQRVSKSESYVYDRLKLLQLIKPAQKLFLDNAFTAGHAILIARLSKKDQERLIEPDTGDLWRGDYGHDPVGAQEFDLGLDHKEHGERSKAISVRELQGWIDDHIRFTAPDATTPHLFVETAENLTAAEATKAKVIEISRDHQLKEDAKHPDGKRTYCVTSWKRADGQPDENPYGKVVPTKTCEYSVLGLVVAGRGRGESFQVCIDKKRCMTHWAGAIKERNKRERAASSSSSSKPKTSEPTEQPWERDQRVRKAKTERANARWAKGGDAVFRAIAPQVKRLSVEGNSAAVVYFLDLLENGIYGIRDTGKDAAKLGVPRGTSPADLIRHLIMIALLDQAEPGRYDATNEKDLQDDLDALKIRVDVVKLLDAANPEPKVEKKAADKKAPAKKKAKKSK